MIGKVTHKKNFAFVMLLSFQSATANEDMVNSAWSASCTTEELIEIGEDGTGTLPISSNQIYLKIKVTPKDKDIYQVNFIEPSDLGRGGLTLDWSKASPEKPIAIIKKLEKSTIDFEWLGISENNTGDTSKFPAPDFYTATHMTMERCR